MLTILLDSSTEVSSAILMKGNGIIAKRSSKGKALTQLHKAIQNVLQDASIRMTDVQRIAVVQGPGSWTGLQVAITSANTLAQVHALPLIPISFLDAIAFSSANINEPFTVVYGSPNGNVFFRTYTASENQIVPATEHQKSTASAFIEILKEFPQPIRLVGAVAEETIAEIKNVDMAGISFEYIVYPSDLGMVKAVNQAILRGNENNDSMISLEPLYMQLASEEPQIYRNRK